MKKSVVCVSRLALGTSTDTLYRYISVRQPSADNSSSLGSKLISSNAPTYDFYLRELLRSELTYLLTYSTTLDTRRSRHAQCTLVALPPRKVARNSTSQLHYILTAAVVDFRTPPPQETAWGLRLPPLERSYSCYLMNIRRRAAKDLLCPIESKESQTRLLSGAEKYFKAAVFGAWVRG